MAIRIITDSTSDVGMNEFENVVVVPLSITIDGKVYRDGIDFTKDEFYSLLENSDALPVTSLASPFAFEEVYKKITEAGDEAIVLPVAKELSGTYQSACIASEDYENITVIDTQLVTTPQRILILRALQLIEEGKTREEIVSCLLKEKEDIEVFALIDVLKYLVKGGRLSKGAAIVGNMIKIKPVLTIEEGTLEVIGKVRGHKQGFKFLNTKIEETSGIDFSRPCLLGYSGSDKSNLLKYMENNELLMHEGKPMDISQLGTAVGTHAGPGVVLVTYFSKK